MKKTNKILEAVILSSLLTMPALVSAENVQFQLGDVMVNEELKVATNQGGP